MGGSVGDTRGGISGCAGTGASRSSVAVKLSGIWAEMTEEGEGGGREGRRWSRGKGKKLYFSQGTQSLHGGCSKQVTGHPGGQEGKGSGSSQNERRFRKRCTPEWKEKPWKVRKPEVSSEDRGLPRWLRQ